jgi:hypothetical protein
MLEVLGETYYIDVDAIIENCRPVYVQKSTEGDENSEEQQIELNVFKFDCYKACLDRVLSEYQEDPDEQDLAAFTNKSTNLSFGIAFNTLLRKEMIKKDE